MFQIGDKIDRFVNVTRTDNDRSLRQIVGHTLAQCRTIFLRVCLSRQLWQFILTWGGGSFGLGWFSGARASTSLYYSCQIIWKDNTVVVLYCCTLNKTWYCDVHLFDKLAQTQVVINWRDTAAPSEHQWRFRLPRFRHMIFGDVMSYNSLTTQCFKIVFLKIKMFLILVAVRSNNIQLCVKQWKWMYGLLFARTWFFWSCGTKSRCQWWFHDLACHFGCALLRFNASLLRFCCFLLRFGEFMLRQDDNLFVMFTGRWVSSKYSFFPFFWNFFFRLFSGRWWRHGIWIFRRMVAATFLALESVRMKSKS